MSGLTGSRRPSWTVWLLNDRDQRVRRLDTVKDGSINLSATDRLGGDATLTIDEATAAEIDWLRDRCQIIYDPGVDNVQPWPVGTFLFSSPTYHRRLVSSWDVGLHTKMLILDEETTVGAWSLPEGANLVENAARLIKATGETRVAVTPSPAASSAPIVFETGESILTVVNALLEAANYWACSTDGSGQYMLQPYVEPEKRPIAYRFEAGETSVHSPEWDRTQDLAAVPNRVECFTAGSDVEEPLFGFAENTDPDSATSWQARGRWVTRRERVEAASQDEIDALAQRYLTGGMSPIGKLTVEHAMLNLRPRQSIRFKSSGIETSATIQKMSMPLSFDAQVKAEWNEIQVLTNVGLEGADV